MSDQLELYYAHMESDRAEAEDAYFKARPQLMRTFAEQALFRAGFEHAYAKLWPLAIIQIDEQKRAERERSVETSAGWFCKHNRQHASVIAVALCGCERPESESDD